MPKKKEILIFEEKGKYWTTSLDVAEKFGKEHRHVTEAMERLIKDVPKNRRIFFEFIYTDSQGREQKAYNITRDGFTLLAMGFTGKKAIKWKLKYIDAFNHLEKLALQTLRMQKDPERIPHRRENLMHNVAFNEAVEEFKIYVKNKSSAPGKSFMIFNNMVNHALFDFPKKLKKIPDKLSIAQLNFSNSARHVVAKEIRRGIKAEEDYKVIKKTCKERVLKIAEALGVTPIPALLLEQEETI